MISTLSDADRALGELSGLVRSLPGASLLARPLIHREAVLSSRLEGKQLSLPDLYLSEAFQASFLENLAGIREVQNYVRALMYGVNRLQKYPLGLALIRELHGLLMEGVRGERPSPGQLRVDQAGSAVTARGASAYVPPPSSEILPALRDLESYLNASSELPPLIRLGLVYYQFQAIQPFEEGNGPLGRLLVSLLLCAWDLLPLPLLYLSAYHEVHRQVYQDILLGISRRGLWEDWLVYFLNGIKTQALDAARRMRYLQELRNQYHARFQSARAADRLLQVIDLLFDRPVLTIQQVGSALGVHYPAVQVYVEQLKQAGILREITGHARNRIYQADEILYAIEGSLLGE